MLGQETGGEIPLVPIDARYDIAAQPLHVGGDLQSVALPRPFVDDTGGERGEPLLAPWILLTACRRHQLQADQRDAGQPCGEHLEAVGELVAQEPGEMEGVDGAGRGGDGAVQQGRSGFLAHAGAHSCVPRGTNVTTARSLATRCRAAKSMSSWPSSSMYCSSSRSIPPGSSK